MTDNLVSRIWSKDGSAWSDDPGAQAMIPGALGWLTTPEAMVEQVPTFELLASEVRAAGFADVFLLGMGGSSLCPEVLRQTFGSAPGFPRLTVIDTTHPEAIARFERAVDLAKTLFLVASKSGGTIETTSLYRYFFERVRALKGDQAGASFIALTDPGTSLEREAQERGFRRIIPTPPDVGGRYSALTPFGLVPAALIGLDLRTLLSRAMAMARACALESPASDNPGLWLGQLLGSLALAGRDKVTLITSSGIASFGLWVEQLLAESTGKEGKGLVPIADEPLGPREIYGRDRVFVYLRLAGEVETVVDEQVAALDAAGHPVVLLELRDQLDLGAEFYRWEFATAVAGAVLRINAFDQPNVQESKDNTSAVLAEYQRSGALPAAESASDEALAAFLQQPRAGEYLAIMAYLAPTEAMDRGLLEVRRRLLQGLHRATTVGYGPRFLHSTGQLHKGGPNSGVFLQLVDEPEQDLPIPGQPYTFGTLIAAQALGDLRSLQTHGRRVLRVNLGSDPLAGLARLERVIMGALPEPE